MKCADLFSGCGGLSLGFENAGIEVVCAIDNWNKSADVYNENFSHQCYLHDLKDEEGTLEILNRYTPDMIAGGPPCQDFSSAGKRDESLGRADMTYHFANIICSYKPKWFVMENVERIKKSHILANVINQYDKAGYGLTAVILSAQYCGVPQARKRFFLMGGLGEKHNVLLSALRSQLNNKPMTIRDYLGNSSGAGSTGAGSIGLDYYYRHPRNYSRRGVFSIDEPSPTVRGVNRPLPPGYKKHSGDPDSVNLSDIRPLTTIERSYIQTFPETFKFTGTKTNLEQMIGNAVPVNLAKFVAKAILEFCKNGELEEQKQVLTVQQNLFPDTQQFKMPNKALHTDNFGA
ncbi:MAG: DNA cytosine methyltransferase [Cycloclasticus sp. symbiont of Poecilosclerida sp. N]|nr:MAG: DNA cytosine methyltransferase [Cycloclasticus sp. symbiont of Poecilosclerida sp. N]